MTTHTRENLFYEVLRRPLITEQGTRLREINKYLFEVARGATKQQIREAVEKAFNVEVTAVNVITVPGKLRRVGRNRGMTSPWRKAIVTLKTGQKIELFEST